MVTTPLAQALADEVERVKVEESASATRAERIADPSIAPLPQQQQPSSGTAAARAAPVTASLAALTMLPPQAIAPLLVFVMDLAVKRGCLWLGDEKTAAKYALTPDERAGLADAWVPAIAWLLPQLSVHPLFLAVGATGLVYGLKALPEGALETALAGAGVQLAPQAVSTADLIHAAPTPPSTPQADPVLSAVRVAQEQLKREQLKKERESEATA